MFLQEVVKQIICKNRSLSFFPLLLNAVKKKALFQSPAPKTAVPSEVKATAWLSNSGFGSSRIEKKKNNRSFRAQSYFENRRLLHGLPWDKECIQMSRKDLTTSFACKLGRQT